MTITIIAILILWVLFIRCRLYVADRQIERLWLACDHEQRQTWLVWRTLREVQQWAGVSHETVKVIRASVEAEREPLITTGSDSVLWSYWEPSRN